MTGEQRASGGARKPFLLAYAALAAALSALVAAAFLLPRSPEDPPPPRPAHHPAIPSTLWGQAIYRTQGMSVTLGPIADQRHRDELGLGRGRLAVAGLFVSNDRGRTFFALEGTPMGRCGYHWQGFGVNAIVAARDCVPVWAVDESGAHAKSWLRVENLAPFARIVFLKYYLPESDLSRGKAP